MGLALGAIYMAGVSCIFLLLSDQLQLPAIVGAMLAWSALFMIALWPRQRREGVAALDRNCGFEM